MSKISKIDDYFRHFRHLSKFTVHFRHLSKIPVHFRYIPVHFREILYRESPVDFRKIFDRQKFSTFGYRELSKVKNFRQTHGLIVHRFDCNLNTASILCEISFTKKNFPLLAHNAFLNPR